MAAAAAAGIALACPILPRVTDRMPVRALAVLSAVLLAACAGAPPSGVPRTVAAPAATAVVPASSTISAAPAVPTDPGDPYEPLNRRVLDVNLGLDDAIFRPVAGFYRDNFNAWTRTRVRNFLDNLNEPANAANSLLQGRPLEAGRSVVRFAANTLLGGAGLFDVATGGGIPRRARDFGQTLSVWGVGDGPYLMLPVAGPSNPRDTVGLIANGFLNPVNYLLPFPANVGRGAVEGVDLREQNIETLDELRSGSLDFYARLRSVSRQRRDAELGRVVPETGTLDLLDDPGAPRR